MKYKESLYIAKKFRKNLTDAERIFWQQVQAGKFYDMKFKRQYIVDKYIIDFYCPKIKLAIEIDGEVHKKQIMRDQFRQKYLEKYGITFIRFSNYEIEYNLTEVLSILIKLTKQLSCPSPDMGRGSRGEDKPL
ncbi:MAG: endonuclease domain-containing protein [Patescibacteria group bacterium]|jgi:very-short-patch-repair endonuclease